MTASRAPRSISSPSRLLELGGRASHVFQFAAPLDRAYAYFYDVPAVFRLLPDALDVRAYGPDRYRLIVGASDGHGHSMAAIFDLQAFYDHGRGISVFPADDGPPINLPGLVFAGALAAEAVFHPGPRGTAVHYDVELAMSIPVPPVLRLMPAVLLQGIGERAMELKMTQIISGFTRNIAADFAARAAGA